MKFQKIIGVPGILIGLAAALLLGSSARAQQEVEPTTFEIVPGVPSKEKAAAPRVVESSETANETKAKADGLATQSGNGPTTESTITQRSASDVAGILVLVTGMGMIVFCAMAATWREWSRNIFTQRKSLGANGERGLEFQALDSVVKQWCERVGPPA